MTKEIENKRKQFDLIKKELEAMERAERLRKEAAEKAIYNPVREENSRCASDYAGFSAGEYNFYYGYEELAPHPLLAKEKNEEDRKTWAFVVSFKGKDIFRKGIIPEHVDWDCNRGLIAGIGYYLEEKTKAVVL